MYIYIPLHYEHMSEYSTCVVFIIHTCRDTQSVLSSLLLHVGVFKVCHLRNLICVDMIIDLFSMIDNDLSMKLQHRPIHVYKPIDVHLPPDFSRVSIFKLRF